MPSPLPGTEGRFMRQTWLVTFADLAALLVTFFVMMFSMSTVPLGRWDEVKQSLTQFLNPMTVDAAPGPGVRVDLPVTAPAAGVNLDYLAGVLRGHMGADSALGEAEIHRADDRLVLSFADGLLFEPGRADLSERGEAMLAVAGSVLRNLRNRIDVAGHADPRPLGADDVDRNWELSLNRASVVAAALRRAGYAGPIHSFGYGDTRYAGIPATLSPERRLALARRVDVIVRAGAAEGR